MLNEVVAMQMFEDIVEKSLSFCCDDNQLKLDILYKYLMIQSLQNISDNLSCIEDLIASVEVEKN